MAISVDPLRPYVGLLRWLGILLVAVILLLAGYQKGSARWEAKFTAEAQAHAADNAAHAAVLQRLADASAQVAAQAKAASTALAKSRAESDTRYQKALSDAKRTERDLAAALRHGDVQLQPHWSCAATGAGASGPAANAVQASAAGRFNSAARIVGAADADAAVIEWLWNGWRADREAVIAAGCAVERSNQPP